MTRLFSVQFGSIQFASSQLGLVWFGPVRSGLIQFDSVRFGLVWFGLVEFGSVRSGPVRSSLVWCGSVWFSAVQYGSVRFGSVQFGSVWFGLVRFGPFRFGLVRFGPVRFGPVQFSSVRFDSVWFGSVRSDTVRFDPVQFDWIQFGSIHLSCIFTNSSHDSLRRHKLLSLIPFYPILYPIAELFYRRLTIACVRHCFCSFPTLTIMFRTFFCLLWLSNVTIHRLIGRVVDFGFSFVFKTIVSTFKKTISCLVLMYYFHSFPIATSVACCLVILHSNLSYHVGRRGSKLRRQRFFKRECNDGFFATTCLDQGGDFPCKRVWE